MDMAKAKLIISIHQRWSTSSLTALKQDYWTFKEEMIQMKRCIRALQDSVMTFKKTRCVTEFVYSIYHFFLLVLLLWYVLATTIILQCTTVTWRNPIIF